MVREEASSLTTCIRDYSAIPTAWTAFALIGRWSLGRTLDAADSHASRRWRSRHCASADMADCVPIALPYVTFCITLHRNTIMLAYLLPIVRHLDPDATVGTFSPSGCRMATEWTTSHASKHQSTLYMHVFSCTSARSPLHVHDEHFSRKKTCLLPKSHEAQLESSNAISSPPSSQILEYHGQETTSVQSLRHVRETVYTPVCRIATCPPPSTAASLPCRTT